MRDDPFELLGVEPRFDLDMAALEARHRALSGALHPDRYSGRPAAERRMALDKAIRVNEAFRALRDPIKRAERLLERAGIEVGETAETQVSADLLMEMMEQREALADARRSKDLDAIGKLGDGMKKRERDVIEALRAGFATRPETPLLGRLGELRYVRRFFDELEAIEDELAEA